MHMGSLSELQLSSPSCRETSGAFEAQAEIAPEALRLRNVRDYRERYILHVLQMQAIECDPGFPLFDKSLQKAKIAWTDANGLPEPVGYYLYSEGRPARHPSALGTVWYPLTFNQVFVRKEHRRKGVATAMMRDFISYSRTSSIWVESPKKETQALLRKLGYEETEHPYQMWEMREGLSCWERYAPNRKRAELTMHAAIKSKKKREWVWSGEEGIGLAELC